MPDKPIEKKSETTKVPVKPPEQVKGGFELFASQPGNELFAMVRMLEALNKNVAFLAVTIDKHLNPDKYKVEEKKNG